MTLKIVCFHLQIVIFCELIEMRANNTYPHILKKVSEYPHVYLIRLSKLRV